MISGEFNYDILKHHHNSLITEFLDVMHTHFLKSGILEPTRIVAKNRPSLQDIIFINTIGKKVSSGNSLDKISHRMPNFVFVKDIFEKKISKKINIRDKKNFYKKTLLKDLDEIKSLDLLKHNSVDEMFNQFQNKFVEIVDKNAPYKTISKREKVEEENMDH